MGRSLSSNAGISNARWDAVFGKRATGRRKDGLANYLSRVDGLKNKGAAEQFTRCLTNSGRNYLDRLTNVKDVIFGNGYDSFSDADLSYFSEMLKDTGNYVGSRGKGKRIVNTESVLARINGLKSNLESVLKSREEERLRTEIFNRLNSGLYEGSGVAEMDLRAISARYKVQQERVNSLKTSIRGRLNSGLYEGGKIPDMKARDEWKLRKIEKENKEKAREKWREAHPYLAFAKRNLKEIQSVAAGLVIGAAGIAAAEAPEVDKSMSNYEPVAKVSLIDTLFASKTPKGSLVSVFGPNRNYDSSGGVESYVVGPISSVSSVKSMVISPESLEGRVEVGLVKEKKKGPGIFSRARDYLSEVGSKAKEVVKDFKYGASKSVVHFSKRLTNELEKGKVRLGSVRAERKVVLQKNEDYSENYALENVVKNAKQEINTPRVDKKILELIGPSPAWYPDEGERTGKLDPRGVLSDEEFRTLSKNNGNILNIERKFTTTGWFPICGDIKATENIGWGFNSFRDYESVKPYLSRGVIEFVSVRELDNKKVVIEEMVPLENFLKEKRFARFR